MGLVSLAISSLRRPESQFICDPTRTSYQDPLFHAGYVFLLLSYLAPIGISGFIYLRSCLVIASIILSVWSYLRLCSIDIFIWNFIFFGVNAAYLLFSLLKIHPFIHFPHDVELVYRDLFLPLKVSRHAFNKLLGFTKEIQTLKAHDIYCVEGKTSVDKLSLLLSGRLAVLQNGRTLHLIDGHQFVDSPEWFGVGSSDTYQVTIIALEESRLIVWHRDKLKLKINTDKYLQTVLDNVLGRDVVRKLLFATDTIGNSVSVDHLTNENTELLIPVHRAMDKVVKREICDSSGLQCFWTLSKVHENTETNV